MSRICSGGDQQGDSKGDSDAATKEACARALRGFYAEMRQLETEERYYLSYSLPSQEGMLRDSVRTRGFQRAITEVCSGGGVVLDVGCGTGVLSAFAAKAGADRVIAVEANAVSAQVATAMVKANKLEEKVLVLEGRLEDLAVVVDREIERCGGKLAVLVSEFVGFGLIHEGMFASVAFARDRWQPRVTVPTAGSVHVSPCFLDGYPQNALTFWMTDLYGLDFSPAAAIALRAHTTQPLSDQVQADHLLADSKQVWRLDCETASAAQAARADPVSVEFEVVRRGRLHGLCIHFDLELGLTAKLSTAPGQASTHWKQLVVLFHAQEGPWPFPTLWPGDRVELSIGFGLVRQRFLEVEAKGRAVSRGGSWKPWTFEQRWVVSPDPTVEPAAGDQ